MNNHITTIKGGGIDIIKFVCSLFIVNIHTWPLYPINENLNFIMLMISRLAVPYFFIASGYLFEIKKSNNENYTYKYIKRISILYIFWFIINSPIIYYHFFVRTNYNDIHDQIINLIIKLCFSSSFRGSWYLSATILCVLIFTYIKRTKIVFLISVGLYILSIIGSTYYYIPISLISNLTKVVNIYEYILHNNIYNSFAAGLLYFYIGTYIAKKRNIKVQCNTFLLLLSALVLIGISITFFFFIKMHYQLRATDSFVLLVPAAILLFYFSLNINTYTTYPLLRKASTIIYMSHFIFISLIHYFWECNNTILFFCVLFSSLILSYVLISLSNKKGIGTIIKYSF